MEEYIESSVNAETVPNVEAQNPIDTDISDGENVSEVATDTEKIQQSKEENAKFAEVRRKAEAEARDKVIAEMYGDQGITTYEQYQQAIREQAEAEERQRMAEEAGVDPDVIPKIYDEMKQKDPSYSAMVEELNQLRTEKQMVDQLGELTAAFPDSGIRSVTDLVKTQEIGQIMQYVQYGLPLVDAYKLANFDKITGKTAEKIQRETLEKISANGESSPGSLVNTGAEEPFFTKEQVDKMSVEEIKKNYKAVMASQKRWS